MIKGVLTNHEVISLTFRKPLTKISFHDKKIILCPHNYFHGIFI